MIKLGAHGAWTKSTYSTGNGACVEVRSAEASTVSLTDSKVADTAGRPVFSVGPDAFTAFVSHVRS